MSAIVSVSVSVFLLMSVTVSISVPARGHVSVPARGHVSIRDRVRVHDRDRIRVRDRIRYILSVSVVVPVTSSARGWGRDHKFERVTVHDAACTFSVAVSTVHA